MLRERITLHRRDIAKTIAAAIQEGAPGDWIGFIGRHQALSGRLRRIEPIADLEALAADLHALHVEVAKSLEGFLETRKTACTACEDGADIQSSKPDFHESEPGFQGSWGRSSEPQARPSAPPSAERAAEGKDAPPSRPQGFPLGMVLDAPVPTSPTGRARGSNWRDFVATAGIVRSGLGISPSAWDDAKDTMGEIPAAIIVAAILQKGEAVKSPGGYLRSLTDKARAGQFSLGPILMALLRAKLGKGERKRA